MSGFAVESSVGERYRLLVVGAEPAFCSAVVGLLSLEGHIVTSVDSRSEALRLLKQVRYDLVLLDLGLKELDGIEMMWRIRELRPDLLIIILASQASLESAIAAIKLAAIDYLPKPVRISQLMNSVNRAMQKRARQLYRQRLIYTIGNAMDDFRTGVMKRHSPQAEDFAQRFVYAPPLLLDRQARLVVVTVQTPHQLGLSTNEIAILESLMAHPGQVVTHSCLAQAIGGEDVTESRAREMVRPQISRLRRKLKRAIESAQLIHTIRGEGYLLEAAQPEQLVP